MTETKIAATHVETFTQLVLKRFSKHRLAFLSCWILLGLVLLALLAPFIESWLGVSHDAATIEGVNLPAAWPHILGTNDVGQDVFARLLFGGRISLSVGIISALASALIGTLIGILAGFYGGAIDSMLMRFTDAMLSVPVLPLMIVFAALDLEVLHVADGGLFKPAMYCFAIAAIILAFRFIGVKKQGSGDGFLRMIVDALIIGIILFLGYYLLFRFIDWQHVGKGNFASVIKLILIIVFFGWMTVARLARAAALQLKHMEFVTAARALGATDARMIMSHILPNALAPIIVATTLEVGTNILYEASLSFLGLGIEPPVSSWGNMLNNAVDYMKTNPALAFWPGFFILITVSCFNFFGDGMRASLDPHQVMKTEK